MQPVVRDDANLFDQQTHAYAEFRLFSRLAAEPVSVASAVVTLGRSDGGSGRHAICWICIVTADGETLHAAATRQHPYAAIDRAVAEIASAVRARLRGPNHRESA